MSLTPRCNTDKLTKPDRRYIGGTEHFDLWLLTNRVAADMAMRLATGGRRDRSKDPLADYVLRVYRIEDGASVGWDTFILPLRENPETNPSAPPLERRISGYWNDLHLTREEITEIETYLWCFCPEVHELLGKPLAPNQEGRK